ncbi:MAG TPA: oligosaccharide flippase family protein [Longimicrobiales bacterium]
MIPAWRKQESSLAVQSVILTAARAAGFALTFAIPLVLVRVFSQDEFGVYKQIFLISATLVPLFNLGLSASLFYFVPRDGGRGQRYVLQALALLALAGAAAGAGLALGGDVLAAALDSPALARHRYAVALFVAISVPAVLIDVLPVVDRRPTLAAWAIAGGDLLRAGAIVVAGVVWRSVEPVVWAAVVAAAARGAGLLAYVRLRAAAPGGRVDARDLAAQLRYALPFALAVVFEIGLTHFHQYFVAAHAPAAQFAIYAVGVLHIPIIGMLVASVVDVMLVRAAEAHRLDDGAALRRLWRVTLERLAAILIPCWALVQLFAGDLIGLLFGPAYLAAVPVFRVFATTLLLWGLVDHGILRATGDTAYIVKANVAGMAASVAAVFALAPASLFLGAIAGYVFGLAVMRALGVRMVARRLGLSAADALPWRTLARVAAAAAGSAAVAAAAYSIPQPLLRLPVGGALFAAAYGFIAYRWELVPRREVAALVRRFRPAVRWSS